MEDRKPRMSHLEQPAIHGAALHIVRAASSPGSPPGDDPKPASKRPIRCSNFTSPVEQGAHRNLAEVFRRARDPKETDSGGHQGAQ